MARYIDAEALLANLKKQYGEELGWWCPVNMSDVGMMIEDAPTADVVEVRHAYWKATTHITESKRHREIHSKLYNCSNCDAPNGRKKSSYCHWCGAKMYVERKDDGT